MHKQQQRVSCLYLLEAAWLGALDACPREGSRAVSFSTHFCLKACFRSASIGALSLIPLFTTNYYSIKHACLTSFVWTEPLHEQQSIP